MAKIRVSCPECGAKYDVDGAYIGRKGRCKKCGATFPISTHVPEVDRPGVASAPPSTAETEAAERRTCRALGFFTASEVPEGLAGGGIRPNEQDKIFLVVLMSVPKSLFLPSEAEFMAIRERCKTGPRPHDVSKENVQVYDLRRFVLILADGRVLPPNLIASGADQTSVFQFGFCGGLRTDISAPAPPGSPNEAFVALAWALSESDCQLPLKVQFGDEPAFTIPDNRLPVPPVKPPVCNPWPRR